MLHKLAKKKLTVHYFGYLILNDLIIGFIALSLSYWFRFNSSLFDLPFGVPSYGNYILPFLSIEILLVILINREGLYRIDFTKKFVDHVFSLIKSIGLAMLLLLAGTFFYRNTTYSRLLILIIGFNLSLFLIVSRLFWRLFYAKNVFEKAKKKILVLGKPETISKITEHVDYFNRYGDIIGFVSTRKSAHSQTGRYIGSIDNFNDILDKYKPDEVILSDLEIPRKAIINLILESEKRLVTFKIVADLFDIMIQKFEIESVDGLNLIKFKESPLSFAYNRSLKRSIDMLGAFLGIIMFSPVFFIVSLIIKATSKGPIFFSQERISEEGKVFKIHKFRSMYQGAESKTGPVFVKKDDGRCTPIGKFLRKYNLDEIPQLYNVLWSEMSLVGPRPERPFFVEQFKDDIPRYMSRHHIKSGITGWAQIHGLRQGTPIEERVRYDLYYAENWSIWLDFKIIFLSFFALKNAY
ncbi:MAG: sugar transferase [Candidatus Omnitrophica bacterium]|jgi:lipopolysaccharide/colanic/teichoic acid biosynthesis glycosyltransferase|nr:sugar transferase [Candidatus Omnitrophota bacterium]